MDGVGRIEFQHSKCDCHECVQARYQMWLSSFEGQLSRWVQQPTKTIEEKKCPDTEQ